MGCEVIPNKHGYDTVWKVGKMFTVYVVNGTYKFSHYGEACSFARRIGGTVEVKKSCNPLRIFNAIYDSI